jgi:(2S)-methylsuccinyl-CoA dehydrogenase
MPHDGHAMPDALTDSTTTSPRLPDLQALTAAALPEVEALFTAGRDGLKAAVTVDGRISALALETRQFQAHALSWLATYVEALRQLNAWAGRLTEAGQFGAMEALILQVGYGEYLNQIAGGIPMSQTELARLSDLGLTWAPGPAAAQLMAAGNTPDARNALVALMRDNHGRATYGASGLDEELEMIRDQFRRYADEKVIPFAQGWHLRDELIPMEVIEDLAGMGVFGLTIPEEHGGLGLTKASMVVVSEELSRGYIGVGSLATRSEIAQNLSFAAALTHKRRSGCRGWPRGRSCRRLCSPSQIPGRTLGPCGPGRARTAMTGSSPATRPGSPMRRGPMS